MFAVKEVARTQTPFSYVAVPLRDTGRSIPSYSFRHASSSLLKELKCPRLSMPCKRYIQEYLKCPLTCSRLNCHGSIFLGRGHMDICRYASLPTEAVVLVIPYLFHIWLIVYNIRDLIVETE